MPQIGFGQLLLFLLDWHPLPCHGYLPLPPPLSPLLLPVGHHHGVAGGARRRHLDDPVLVALPLGTPLPVFTSLVIVASSSADVSQEAVVVDLAHGGVVLDVGLAMKGKQS